MSISNAVTKINDIDDSEFDVEAMEAEAISQKEEVKKSMKYRLKVLMRLNFILVKLAFLHS